jgi:hypothetical protein
MPEEPIGDDTRIPTQESDIVDEWITSLKESLEEGNLPLGDDEMLNLEMAIMEQIDNLDNETIAQQIEYHSMVRAMATLAGDQSLAMDANQNVELWEMCAARKGFTKEWEAEGNIAFAAEDTGSDDELVDIWYRAMKLDDEESRPARWSSDYPHKIPSTPNQEEVFKKYGFDRVESALIADQTGNPAWIWFTYAKENRSDFAAENTSLEADYDTTGTLSNLFKFGSGDDEAIGGFTPEELAKSSAIHGDFNQASLGYSGHQNIQLKGESIGKYTGFCCGEQMELQEVESVNIPGMVDWVYLCPICGHNDTLESQEESFEGRMKKNAENQDMMCCGEQMEFYGDGVGEEEPHYFYCPVCEKSIETKEFEAPMDVFNPGRTDVENSVAAALRHAKDDTKANWKLYTAFRPLYYIHTVDQGQPKNVKGVSNKFLTFFIIKKDGANVFRAYNAFARIGYTPGNNQVFNNYQGDLSNAEAALRNKISVKTKSRRSSGTYVLRQYAEETSTGKCDCGVNCVCDCGCAESGVCNCGPSCPCNCGCGVKAAEDGVPLSEAAHGWGAHWLDKDGHQYPAKWENRHQFGKGGQYWSGSEWLPRDAEDWDEDSEGDYDPWMEGGEGSCSICADAAGHEEAGVGDSSCPRCGWGGICEGCAEEIAKHHKSDKRYRCGECAGWSDEDAADELKAMSAEDSTYPSVTLAYPYKTGFKMYFGALAGAATMVIGLMGLTALLIRNKE